MGFTNIRLLLTDVDGTLTDGCTYYSARGEELKKFNHRDGRGVFLLRSKKIDFGIITGENSEIVLRRAEKLDADYCFTGVEDKLSFVIENLTKKYNLDEIAFIGDDTNDLALLKNVGVSFAVNDAMTEVKNEVDYICTKKGGEGAFREAVEFLLNGLTKRKKTPIS